MEVLDANPEIETERRRERSRWRTRTKSTLKAKLDRLARRARMRRKSRARVCARRRCSDSCELRAEATAHARVGTRGSWSTQLFRAEDSCGSRTLTLLSFNAPFFAHSLSRSLLSRVTPAHSRPRSLPSRVTPAHSVASILALKHAHSSNARARRLRTLRTVGKRAYAAEAEALALARAPATEDHPLIPPKPKETVTVRQSILVLLLRHLRCSHVRFARPHRRSRSSRCRASLPAPRLRLRTR